MASPPGISRELPPSRRGLIITPNQPDITVDDLEVAQFIYLLLTNPKIRKVIDTIGKKAVLILGRFTDERKPVLDALREELRRRDYLPILFDFEKPTSDTLLETVSPLAHLAKFVIADVTDAKVVLEELGRIVPHLPSVPVQPLLLKGSAPTLSLTDFAPYSWFLRIFPYESQEHLIAFLGQKVIAPAEAKVAEIQQRLEEAEEDLKALGKS